MLKPLEKMNERLMRGKVRGRPPLPLGGGRGEPTPVGAEKRRPLLFYIFIYIRENFSRRKK
jgi:hypothetical protein